MSVFWPRSLQPRPEVCTSDMRGWKATETLLGSSWAAMTYCTPQTLTLLIRLLNEHMSFCCNLVLKCFPFLCRNISRRCEEVSRLTRQGFQEVSCTLFYYRDLSQDRRKGKWLNMFLCWRPVVSLNKKTKKSVWCTFVILKRAFC